MERVVLTFRDEPHRVQIEPKLGDYSPRMERIKPQKSQEPSNVEGMKKVQYGMSANFEAKNERKERAEKKYTVTEIWQRIKPLSN
jgi:hypothetical protein